MKRNTCLKSIILVVLCMILFVTGGISASGNDKVAEHHGSKYHTTSVVEANYLFGGIKHTKYTAESSYAQNTIDSYVGQTFANRYYTQSVNTLEVPNNGLTKIVQWAYHPSSSATGWMLTSVNIMAKNYEERNPGYKVLAVINGDFFDISAEGAYGPLLKTTLGVGVSDGEVIRPYDARGLENNPLTIGFKNNGKADNYVQGGKIEFTANHMLALYDEKGNITEELEIEYINEKPDYDGIAVYFTIPTGVGEVPKKQGYKLVDIPGENAYICKTPYRFVPSTATDIYAKGELTKISEEQTIEWGSFGIVTQNSDVRAKIESAAYVRVQKNVVGDYAECESIGGGVFPLLLNNEEFYNQDVYRHPRTVIGAKADGSIVMATVDGRQKDKGYWGMTSDELGALMQYYGCVSAVNLDGGGSSTIMIRDEKGEFQVKNSPSDGQLRFDSNCYLVVAKEADFSIESQEISEDTITFNLNTTDVNFDEVTNIKCTLNGVTKEVIDNKVTFDGLSNNKTYEYAFSYDTETKKDIMVMLSGKVTTAKLIPTQEDIVAEVVGDTIIFTPDLDDPDAAITSYKILIKDTEGVYDGEPIKIKIDLTGLDKVEFDVVITYNLNDGLGDLEESGKFVYIVATGEIYLYGEEPEDPVDPDVPDDPVDPDPDDPVDPDPVDPDPVEPDPSEDKGCKKDLSIVIVSLISLSGLLVLIKKRK